MRLLLDRAAAMTVGYNGRLFQAKARYGDRIGLIWDGQIYDTGVWVISKSAQNPEAARRFIAFAVRPDRLAAQAELFPYGPSRRSAVAAVGSHKVIGIALEGLLPTSANNLNGALRFSQNWWRRSGDAARRRFEDWLATTARAGAR